MLIMTHKRSNVVSLGRVPSSNAFQFRLFNCVLDDRPKKLAQLLAEAGTLVLLLRLLLIVYTA